MPRPRALFPRSLWTLLLLLLAAGAWLVWGERLRRPAAPPAAAPAPRAAAATGPLGLATADLVALEARFGGRTIALAREGQGWRFVRGCDDWVDTEEAQTLAQAACEAALKPLLSEGEVDPLQVGLSGPEAVELRLTARDGRTVDLTIGRRNPVLNACYARWTGGPGIWTLPYALRVRLISLPDDLRLRRLWPAFDVAVAETLARRPSGAAVPDLFARDAQGRWWLRAPADDRRAGPIFPVYARWYGDRVALRDGVAWWRARDRAVTELIFKFGLVNLSGFGESAAPAEALRAAGLLPAPLSVRLVCGDAGTLTASFGGDLEPGAIAALRGGRSDVLFAPATARQTADAPLADLLDTDALPVSLAAADSLLVAPDEGEPVRAWRDGRAWRTLLPAAPGSRSNPSDFASDLAVAFDRLPIERVLPPAPAGREPLASRERYRLTVWLPGSAAPAFVGVIGRLAEGVEPAARGGPVPPPAALWVPDSRQLLVVPQEILITLRTFFTGRGQPLRP